MSCQSQITTWKRQLPKTLTELQASQPLSEEGIT